MVTTTPNIRRCESSIFPRASRESRSKAALARPSSSSAWVLAPSALRNFLLNSAASCCRTWWIPSRFTSASLSFSSRIILSEAHNLANCTSSLSPRPENARPTSAAYSILIPASTALSSCVLPPRLSARAESLLISRASSLKISSQSEIECRDKPTSPVKDWPSAEPDPCDSRTSRIAASSSRVVDNCLANPALSRSAVFRVILKAFNSSRSDMMSSSTTSIRFSVSPFVSRRGSLPTSSWEIKSAFPLETLALENLTSPAMYKPDSESSGITDIGPFFCAKADSLANLCFASASAKERALFASFIALKSLANANNFRAQPSSARSNAATCVSATV